MDAPAFLEDRRKDTWEPTLWERSKTSSPSWCDDRLENRTMSKEKYINAKECKEERSGGELVVLRN